MAKKLTALFLALTLMLGVMLPTTVLAASGETENVSWIRTVLPTIDQELAALKNAVGDTKEQTTKISTDILDELYATVLTCECYMNPIVLAKMNEFKKTSSGESKFNVDACFLFIDMIIALKPEVFKLLDTVVEGNEMMILAYTQKLRGDLVEIYLKASDSCIDVQTSIPQNSVLKLYDNLLNYCKADRAGQHSRKTVFNAYDVFASEVQGLLMGFAETPTEDTIDKELSEAIDAWIAGGMAIDTTELLRAVVASLTDWLPPPVTVETMSATDCMDAIMAAHEKAVEQSQADAFNAVLTAFNYPIACQFIMEVSLICKFAVTTGDIEFCDKVEEIKAVLNYIDPIPQGIVELAKAENEADSLKTFMTMNQLLENLNEIEKEAFYDDDDGAAFEAFKAEYIKELSVKFSTEKEEQSDLSKVAKLLAAGVATVIAVRTVTKTAKLVIGVPAALAFAPQILQTLNRLVFHRFF